MIRAWHGRAVAALAVAVGSAWAAAAEEPASAVGFLQTLYATYTPGIASSPLGPGAEHLFAPPLLELIRADQALAGGEVGTLDHDPICACQDFAALRHVTISLRPDGPEHVRATVSFSNAGQAVAVRFRLIGAAGQWRIEDVAEPGIPSLRRFLADGIARQARERAVE